MLLGGALACSEWRQLGEKTGEYANGGTGTGSGSGGAGTCSSDVLDPDEDVVIDAREANNYRVTSTLKLSSTTVAPKSDLNFDWSQATYDFLGRSLDPAKDVEMMTVSLFNLSKAELHANLQDDTLSQKDLNAFAMLYTNAQQTQVAMHDLTSFGEPIVWTDWLARFDADTFDPASHTYLAALSTGTVFGKGVRAMQLFTLDPSTTNTKVIIDSSSSIFTYFVDLHRQRPLYVPSGKSNLVFDWTAMDGKRNAMGSPFESNTISRAWIASFAQSPSELETLILGPEPVAKNTWSVEIDNETRVSLAAFKDARGRYFNGIDTTQTWLLGLDCDSCVNPAPPYVTILEACSN
jgi:hypothetical protein